MYLNAIKSYTLNLEIDFDPEIDLHLDPMTFIYELDLDIVNIYLHTKNKVRSSRCSNVRARTDGHTDTQKDRHTSTQTERQAHATENFIFPL